MNVATPIAQRPEAVIQVSGGTYIDIANPRLDDIHITDIAAALSKLCRFTGHVRQFYSVAQHSIMCSWAANTGIEGMELLMHDAHEAYVGDVNSPLKALCPEYQAIEATMDSAIRAKFGLRSTIPKFVQAVDRRMLITEVKALMRDPAPPWAPSDDPAYPPLPWGIGGLMSPDEAEERFLSAYFTFKKRIENGV